MQMTETWTETSAYVAGDVQIDAHVGNGVARVAFVTDKGRVSLVCVPLVGDGLLDPATVLHDLLTAAARQLENAVAAESAHQDDAVMNAQEREAEQAGNIPNNSPTNLPHTCQCPEWSGVKQHQPWCHLARVTPVDTHDYGHDARNPL